ncbi:hypothetical protein HZS61_008994 [Fusarium oxysporum f. sp. conglutinans]|uniref:Uncharacterized protein n=1 Tax=Fusarium oxysporum f. sp. conglutinans TaxID=100902 RepID=A0A8H6LPI2_FUSOX|nr:hypothetical protein HZS61_008994 [Fusarium oxysporum f. sp. conglutinans]
MMAAALGLNHDYYGLPADDVVTTAVVDTIIAAVIAAVVAMVAVIVTPAPLTAICHDSNRFQNRHQRFPPRLISPPHGS